MEGNLEVFQVEAEDDVVIEGNVIKSHLETESSDSESEDDKLIFVTRSSTLAQSPYEQASPYVRSDTKRPGSAARIGLEPKPTTTEVDLKPLRFSYYKTAFDVDFDDFTDHPWRQPHTDISDYFNYGFKESTWMVYCEKQLRYRAEMDEGPSATTALAASTAPPMITNFTTDNPVAQKNQQRSAEFLNNLDVIGSISAVGDSNEQDVRFKEDLYDPADAEYDIESRVNKKLRFA